jgi:hypothetical protein
MQLSDSPVDRPDLRKFTENADCPYKANMDSAIAAIANAQAERGGRFLGSSPPLPDASNTNR